MKYLANGLKKYYRREKTRILFQNGSSLQEFAISLWEKLGFTQVDISVLSRVLKGERLFTPVQLEAFCEILKLSPSESAYLFRCLSQDYLLKGGVKTPELFESTSVVDTLDFLDHLVQDTYKTFHNGVGVKIEKTCNILQTYLDQLSHESLSETHQAKLYDLMAISIYIYGRNVCTHVLPENVIRETTTIANQFKKLIDLSNNPKAAMYLNLFLGEVYYIAGGYSFGEESRQYYEKAVNFNKDVLQKFDLNECDRLVALRNGLASANYIQDESTIAEVRKQATESILGSSPDVRIVGLQLTGTLAKSSALYKHSDPFKLREIAIDHYGTDITGGGFTEVSDLKTEMETLQLLGTDDKKHLRMIITKGLILSERENTNRHTKLFFEALKNLE